MARVKRYVHTTCETAKRVVVQRVRRKRVVLQRVRRKRVVVQRARKHKFEPLYTREEANTRIIV